LRFVVCILVVSLVQGLLPLGEALQSIVSSSSVDSSTANCTWRNALVVELSAETTRVRNACT
jgi:hypothetical protein